MLPIDVSNSRFLYILGNYFLQNVNFRLTTQLNMKLYWDIAYMAIAFFVVVLLPFAILFYESDPDRSLVQFK